MDNNKAIKAINAWTWEYNQAITELNNLKPKIEDNNCSKVKHFFEKNWNQKFNNLLETAKELNTSIKEDLGVTPDYGNHKQKQESEEENVEDVEDVEDRLNVLVRYCEEANDALDTAACGLDNSSDYMSGDVYKDCVDNISEAMKFVENAIDALNGQIEDDNDNGEYDE